MRERLVWVSRTWAEWMGTQYPVSTALMVGFLVVIIMALVFGLLGHRP